MTIKHLTFLLVFLLFSSNASAESYQIDDDTAFYVYEVFSEIKTPREELAEYISKDYRRARDEFSRHDLLVEINPVLDKRIEEAASAKLFNIRIGGKLGEYDFDKKGFKTGFSENTFVPYSYGYAASFTNIGKAEYLPVTVEKARTFASSLGKSRKAIFKIVGEVEYRREVH